MTILGYDNNGTAMQVTGWPSAENIAFSGTSAQSSVFSADTFLVRLVASENCRVAFGADPTATGTSSIVLAGLPEYVKVTPGHRLAVIQDSEAGSLNVTFCG